MLLSKEVDDLLLGVEVERTLNVTPGVLIRVATVYDDVLRTNVFLEMWFHNGVVAGLPTLVLERKWLGGCV